MANCTITSCLSSYSSFLFFYETFIALLQVIMTNLAQSFYELSHHLLSSFLFSRLARHKVKPRLSRISWKDFVATYSLMLFLSSSKKSFLVWSSFFLGNHFLLAWSSLFQLYTITFTLLFFVKTLLLLTWTLFQFLILCFRLWA